jgi:hypothetical protein
MSLEQKISEQKITDLPKKGPGRPRTRKIINPEDKKPIGRPPKPKSESPPKPKQKPGPPKQYTDEERKLRAAQSQTKWYIKKKYGSELNSDKTKKIIEKSKIILETLMQHNK